jgi:hypothetical protein
MSISPEKPPTAPVEANDRDSVRVGDPVVPSVLPVIGRGVLLTGGVGEGVGRSPTPVLITEQEVVFSTSAALPVRRTKGTSWLTGQTRRIIAALRGMFLTAIAGARPARRHYPPRTNGYLEHSRMVRKLDRL